MVINFPFLLFSKLVTEEKINLTFISDKNIKILLMVHLSPCLGTHKFLCRICNRAYQSNPGRLKHEQFEHGSLPLLQVSLI